jgi:hypothetical protein
MTDFLKSRLPPGANSTLIAGINSLNETQLMDLERWVKRNEELLGRTVELLDVHLQSQGRGFEASVTIGLSFLE